MYVPFLAFRLLGNNQAGNPIEAETNRLLASVWLTACQTAWLWTVGMELGRKNQWLSQSALTALKVSLFVPITYVSVFAIHFLGAFAQEGFSFLTFDHYNYLHTASLIGFVYPVYYNARSLTSLEQHQLVGLDGSFLTFLAIIIFPIGIFSVQPRVKKVLRPTEESSKRPAAL